MLHPLSDNITNKLELWEVARDTERRKRDRRFKRERQLGVVGRRRGLPTKEWFMAMVEIVESGCWNWCRCRDRKGYGRLSASILKKTPLLAHRVAWVLWNGAIPSGLCVLHHCDNPRCCNPQHLFLGTVADNNADRCRKGRTVIHPVSGERHRNAKLTATKARQIFLMPGKQREIAKLFAVSQHTVWLIKAGLLWKHIHHTKPEIK